LPIDPPRPHAIPLSPWADAQLGALAGAAGSNGLNHLSGAGLLGERATLNGFTVPGRISAGGACRFFEAQDGFVAINLARRDDRDLLPALFGVRDLNVFDDASIAQRAADSQCAVLVSRGRELGLALAHERETLISDASHITVEGPRRAPRAPMRRPLVIDLSALWAGPLAAHLLWLLGARVVKVESRTRPDALREGDPPFFALLNQGKDSVLLDFRDREDLSALIRLVSSADIVIEAARPRALLQLGLDADVLVRKTPGLVWVTITAHGVEGDAANWTGFGDDCGVAGGLSAALTRASGKTGFVGDALADPLTGVLAARLAWERWASGKGGRCALSMSGVVAEALAEENATNAAALSAGLKAWAKSEGRPFPAAPPRKAHRARALGADTRAWMKICAPC
jgi:hypothetical protein